MSYLISSRREIAKDKKRRASNYGLRKTQVIRDRSLEFRKGTFRYLFRTAQGARKPKTFIW